MTPAHDIDEVNRLLLNYLSTVYSITQHVNGSFRRRYKDSSNETAQASNWLEETCTKEWHFACALDLRGLIQHRGSLPFHYNLLHGLDGTKAISLYLRASEAFHLIRVWQHSKLNQSYGDIDLLKVVSKTHEFLTNSLFQFSIEPHLPELIHAAAFYDQLAATAKTTVPEGDVVLIKELPKIEVDGAAERLNLSFITLPVAVFEELGIRISVNLDDSAQEAAASQS